MKNMNIFKQLFNWIQSAPADFCYVTGEWGFQAKASAKPVLSSNAFQSVNNRRSSEALRTPVVTVTAARISAPAAAPVVVTTAAHDPELIDLCIHSAHEQNAYTQVGT
jgi:hypothetical protein